jgi:hypothetical protein
MNLEKIIYRLYPKKIKTQNLEFNWIPGVSDEELEQQYFLYMKKTFILMILMILLAILSFLFLKNTSVAILFAIGSLVMYYMPINRIRVKRKTYYINLKYAFPAYALTFLNNYNDPTKNVLVLMEKSLGNVDNPVINMEIKKYLKVATNLNPYNHTAVNADIKFKQLKLMEEKIGTKEAASFVDSITRFENLGYDKNEVERLIKKFMGMKESIINEKIQSDGTKMDTLSLVSILQIPIAIGVAGVFYVGKVFELMGGIL